MEIATRKEKMIEAIIKDDPSLIPTPVSREEMMLASMAKVTCDGNGGGGIKTAIIKQVGYDAYLNGELTSEPDESWKYECVNMTRDEAIQIIMNGEQLDVVVYEYEFSSSGGGWRGSVRYPGVRYRPGNDNMEVIDLGGWYDDGIYLRVE